MARPNKRMLFASPHCLVDFASGAALATRDALELLAHRGFECRAFCASKMDGNGQGTGIRGQGAEVRSQKLVISGQLSTELTHFQNGSVPVTVFQTESPRIEEWSPGEAEAMLAAFERVLGDFRPDVLLTYGGHPINSAMMQFARRRGIPVVFGLHNFAYLDARVFQDVDHVGVPSEFSREWYGQKLGLKCHVLPYCIDFSRVESPKTRVESQRGRQASETPRSTLNSEPNSGSQPSALRSQLFLTFVNPQPAKGLYVFARIAEQLQRRRPEIPILVVESRGVASWLEQTGLDLSWCQNLHAMENTHDPRDFYRVTKLLLVPSLWNESFGLVAAEAMINGIPVLGSDRGALPEVVGGRESRSESRGPEGTGSQRSGIRGQLEEAAGGFLFEIPSRYTPETTFVPTAEEVEPWVETIVRLWDDEKLYRECAEKAKAHAQRWHPDRLGPMYAEFFRNVRPQPGPPFLKRAGERGTEGEGERQESRGPRAEIRGQGSEISNQQLAISAPHSAVFQLTTHDSPLTPSGPLLSLCMIARDNERTIGAALEIIRNYVDDIVVVDTGSKDRTPEIAASLGARVFHFPWCDDFSAARNESIRHALGQWIFWMDTDDVIDEENASKVRKLVEDRGSRIEDGESRTDGRVPVLGYLMKVRCPSADANGDGGFIEVDQVKLFRNLPHLRFELRIHEQILMAIRRAGGVTPWTDIFVVHANADISPEGRARKIERDLRILQLDHAERPDHPFVLFNLGMTLAEAGRHVEENGDGSLLCEAPFGPFRQKTPVPVFYYEAAINYLWQSVGRAGDDDSHLRKVFALLVSSYRHLGRHVTGWETCLKGLKQFPDDPELRYRQATMLREFGNLPDAARAYEDLLVLKNGCHLSSVDRAIQGYRARQNLAAVYTELGEFAKAEEQWRRVVEEVPDDPAFRERHCRLLFEHFAPSEAEPAFRELIARDPQNAAAYHNLGSILYKLGRFDESTAAYRESLKYRPNFAWTHLHLGYALREAGKTDGAVAAWEEARQVVPAEDPMRKELEQLITTRGAESRQAG